MWMMISRSEAVGYWQASLSGSRGVESTGEIPQSEMSEPTHIKPIIKEAFSAVQQRSCLGNGLNEYLVISADDFHDFRRVARSRHLDFDYSIEDSEDGEIEYHIHSHLQETEDILWALQVLAESESGIEQLEPALYYG
jgi:hypothetical protein